MYILGHWVCPFQQILCMWRNLASYDRDLTMKDANDALGSEGNKGIGRALVGLEANDRWISHLCLSTSCTHYCFFSCCLLVV